MQGTVSFKSVGIKSLHTLGMSALTAEDRAVLARMEQAREKHRLRQQKYIQRQKELNKNFDVEHAAYMRKYNASVKETYMTVQEKLNKQNVQNQPLKTVQIPNIEVPKVDRRTRKGQRVLDEFEIRPSYQIRRDKGALSGGTTKQYIQNINLVQKDLLGKELRTVMKAQILKLLNNTKNEDAAVRSAIVSELSYLKDVDAAIKKLRELHQNDSTFKSRLQAIVAVTSRIPDMREQYQKLTKTAIEVNNTYEAGRADNILAAEDEGKIINIDFNTALENIQKLNTAREKLLYAIYTLIPARRVKDYYLLKVTNDKPLSELDDDYNYIMIGDTMKLVFNNYKTKSKMKQQVFDIPTELQLLFSNHIRQDKLKDGNYIFHQSTGNNVEMAQSNFSTAVKQLFAKVHGANITVKNIRQSWATEQNNDKSLTERRQVAYAMAHSVDQQLRYAKKSNTK